MTLQYIMRKSLCREPHCFSAHVPGQGYVNKGEPPYDRADYIRQYVRTATSEIKNMGWADGYAEPGSDQPKRGVLLANWNNLPRELGDLLERAGYSCEWSDEWAVCDDCNKAVRTQPDGYSWRPYYDESAIERGEMLCLGCVESPDTDQDQDQEHTS